MGNPGPGGWFCGGGGSISAKTETLNKSMIVQKQYVTIFLFIFLKWFPIKIPFGIDIEMFCVLIKFYSYNFWGILLNSKDS